MKLSKRFSIQIFAAFLLGVTVATSIYARAESREYRIKIKSLAIDTQKYKLKAGDSIYLKFAHQMGSRDIPRSEDFIHLSVGEKGEVLNQQGKTNHAQQLHVIYPIDDGYIQVTLWKANEHFYPQPLETCRLQPSTGKCLAKERLKGQAPREFDAFGLNYVEAPIGQ